AFEHQQCTFTELLPRLRIGRDASRVPLVPVTFNVDRIMHALRFGELDAEVRAGARRFDSFEWTVSLIAAGDTATIEMMFNSSLFAASTMRLRLAEFESLLRSAIASPETGLDRLSVLPVAERDRQLIEWNATEREYPRVSLPEYLGRGFADGSA